MASFCPRQAIQIPADVKVCHHLGYTSAKYLEALNTSVRYIVLVQCNIYILLFRVVFCDRQQEKRESENQFLLNQHQFTATFICTCIFLFLVLSMTSFPAKEGEYSHLYFQTLSCRKCGHLGNNTAMIIAPEVVWAMKYSYLILNSLLRAHRKHHLRFTTWFPLQACFWSKDHSYLQRTIFFSLF